MTTQDSNFRSMADLVRGSSLSRLKSLSKRDQIEIQEIQKEPLVFAHWMSFILVSGKALRIIFKTHFMTKAAQFFAAKTYGTDPHKISQEKGLDFAKEFCNLTAGQIKLDLNHNSVIIGASLPGMTRGFDEIFYPQQPGSMKVFWSLKCESEKFDCSANIEILEPFEFKKTEKAADDGEVEYL